MAGTTAGRRDGGLLWDLPLFFTVVIYVVLAPYTKVEESFNMQAAHDILRHGTDLRSYDHQQFPGAVPRTFLGALAAAAIASPAAALRLAPLARLYAVRLAVGLISVAAHARLRAAVAVAWGPTEGRILGLLAAMQFHLPFYMSRTLPNTFALALSCLAHAELIGGSGYAALAILGSAAAVFRCDLLVLIAPLGLTLLAQGRVRFFRAALATAAAAAAGAALSVGVDSLFWGRPLWPEFEVLWFNTAQNKSGEWGTSPPLWYFYSALPRALLGAVPLAMAGALLERRARGPLIIAVSFVLLYSMLPHKELRFLFPGLPLFNVAASAGAARLGRRKGLHGFALKIAFAGVGAASLLAAMVMAAASVANYPGGVAMDALHRATPVSPPLSVHIGNLAATTGVSRFLEVHSAWNYSKEEHLQPQEFYSRGFDRILAEWPEVPGFECEAVVLGFDRLAIRRGGFADSLGALASAVPGNVASAGGFVGLARQFLEKVPVVAVETVPQVYVLTRGGSASDTWPCDDASPRWAG